jgi:hypothetical protein
MSCEELENIYEEMNNRNQSINLYDIKYDTNLDKSTDYCYAIYSLGNWYLQPSWLRLNKYIREIITEDIGCFYSVHPSATDGMLHQTLLQFISFANSNKYNDYNIKQSLEECYRIIKEYGKYLQVTYRGLVWTKTGLALRGYPNTSKDYEYIMNIRNRIETALKEKKLPCDIPYKNDILHSTFLRWKTPPSQEVIDKLNNTINKWDECVFGEVRISEWNIGKASWKMLDSEREDIYSVRVPKILLHRGNNRIDNLPENDPATINIRNNEGYAVECDIWFKEEKWYLGHDAPEYEVLDLEEFLSERSNLIHAKDGKTFAKLLKYCRERGFNNEIFYHTSEDYVLTTRENIIAYPGKTLYNENFCMMPESMGRDITEEEKKNIVEICSDNIDLIRSIYNI